MILKNNVGRKINEFKKLLNENYKTFFCPQGRGGRLSKNGSDQNPSPICEPATSVHVTFFNIRDFSIGIYSFVPISRTK